MSSGSVQKSAVAANVEAAVAATRGSGACTPYIRIDSSAHRFEIDQRVYKDEVALEKEKQHELLCYHIFQTYIDSALQKSHQFQMNKIFDNLLRNLHVDVIADQFQEQ